MRRLILVFAAGLLCLAPSVARAQVYGDPSSLVDYWYRTYLGRAPDAGMATWVVQLNQGVPADQVLSGILGSGEYYSRAGSTPQGYITRLHQDILRRPPSPAELDFWVRRMYIEDRQAIADEILTQNPGTWVGTSTAVTPPTTVTPPVVVTPGIEWYRHRDWDRDRHWEWDRHHDIHEYRRPDIYYHRDEHGPKH
jgi:hypothetical protein